MDEVLQQLYDENEVKRLVLTWMDGVDTRSYERFTSAWAEEMEVEFIGFPPGAPLSSGTFNTAQRTQGLISMISEFSSTQHVNTNHLVTVKGDHATCSCYVVATHYMQVENGEPWSSIGVRYDLEASRGEQGWKLTKLKWTRQWTSGNEGLWAEAARRMALRSEGK
jgi:hypothetical protein